jgi:hypothetical protein
MAETDRMYAFQEMSAFYLSWLVGFEIPVLNPACPNGLGGRNFHTLELFSLAVASGLGVPSINLDTKFPDRDGWHSSQLISSDLLTSPQIYLIVVQDQLIADHQRNDHPPADVVEGCLELSRRTDLPLLGLHFVAPRDEPWMLIAVNPLPDLTVGGPALIEALAAALTDNGIKGDKRS